jgi:tetratricopeptide (TPR) repeat protein
MKHVGKLFLMVIMMLSWVLQGSVAGTVTNVTPQAVALLKKAYVAVVEAELARSENQNTEAAKSYRAALECYEKLKTDYPGWQAFMISGRMTECENALAALEMPREPEAVLGKNLEAEAETSNDVVRLQVLLKELQSVKEALASAKTTGDESNSKQMAAEVDRLKDELNDAAKDKQILQRKILKLDAKLNKTSAGSGTNSPCKAVVSAVKSEANRLMKANGMVPAIALLIEATELMPEETDLVVLLAVANCRDGRFGDAVKLMAPFDVWRAKNADALLTLGTAYMGLGEVGKARDAIEKTLSIKPESAEAHYNMAQILITISPPDVPGAQEHYQQALELGSPVDPEFENALRTAMIITRMKKKSGSDRRTTTRSINTEVRNPGAKTDTP